MSPLAPYLAGDFRIFAFIANLTAPQDFVEGMCDGYHVVGSGGAAYKWCNKALKILPEDKIGHSFGINAWDPWSRELSNQFKIPMHLYDCIYTKPLQGKNDEYDIPYKRHNLCVGASNYVINHQNGDRVFKELHELIDFSAHKPLSMVVKMDIEGSEWEVLQKMTALDHSRIVFFDLEIHWCKGKISEELHQKPRERARTIMQLLVKLKSYYYITGREMSRSREWDLILPGKWLVWEDAGCQIDSQYDMMSVSYVNKKVFLEK